MEQYENPGFRSGADYWPTKLDRSTNSEKMYETCELVCESRLYVPSIKNYENKNIKVWADINDDWHFLWREKMNAMESLWIKIIIILFYSSLAEWFYRLNNKSGTKNAEMHPKLDLIN